MSETTQITSAIRTSSETAKIYTEICALQSELTPIPKDGVNTQQNYSYAKFDSYIQVLKPILSKHNIFILTAQHEPIALEPRQTKNNSVVLCTKICLTIRLVHISGEWIEVDAYGEGQDHGDKALYKAITGARKYGLACMLGLGTSDDPENEDPKTQKTATIPPKYTKPPVIPPNYSKDATPPANSQNELQRYLNALEHAPTEQELKKTLASGWRALEKNKSALGRIKDKYEQMKQRFVKTEPPKPDTPIQLTQKE